MSVRHKIVLAMFVLSFALVLLMGTLSLGLADQILETRAREFMTAIVDRSAFEINQQILSSENEVDSIYQDVLTTYEPDRVGRDPGYGTEYLKKVSPSVDLAAELNPSKEAFLFLLDPKDPWTAVGSIYYSDADHDGQIRLSDPGNLLLRLESALDRPEAPGSPGKIWVVGASDRHIKCFTLVTKDGRRTALMGVSLDKDLVKNRIRRTTYLSSGFLFLTDQVGRVIYHPQMKEGAFLGPLGNDRELKFFSKTDPDGNEVLFGHLVVQNGWHLGLQVRKTDIRKGLDLMVGLIVTVMVAALGVAVSAGLMAGDRIGRPYIYLSREIEKIGSGNYEIELAPRYLARKDEAGTLTRAIDQMIRRQRESFELIRNQNLNLEKTIEVRTSELVRSNRSLARSEKIASLTYMVGGIAHQMNTPMGNAMVAVSFLEDELGSIRKKIGAGDLEMEELDDRLDTAWESCRLVQRSLEKSIRLVDQFKGLAPVKQTGSQAAHNLGQVIRHRAGMVSRKYPQVPCRFTWEIPEDLELCCNIDNLDAIFRELLENSFVHGFQGEGTLEVLVRIEGAGGSDQGIRVFYADNGVGITQDQISKLFTPFYTTRMGQDHSGLGLNMVYNLILGVFDGDIQIDESAGPGLAFLIRLVSEPLPAGEEP